MPGRPLTLVASNRSLNRRSTPPPCLSTSGTNSTDSLKRSLPDTLQLLALHRPQSLLIIERLAQRLVEPVLQELDADKEPMM